MVVSNVPGAGRPRARRAGGRRDRAACPSKGVSDRTAYDQRARRAAAPPTASTSSAWPATCGSSRRPSCAPSAATAATRGCPRVMNIHPALLPSFPGCTPSGRRSTTAPGSRAAPSTSSTRGPTPARSSRRPSCRCSTDDTEPTLAARILEQEHRLYPQAIQWFAQGRLSLAGRRVRVDGGARAGAASLAHEPPPWKGPDDGQSYRPPATQRIYDVCVLGSQLGGASRPRCSPAAASACWRSTTTAAAPGTPTTDGSSRGAPPSSSRPRLMPAGESALGELAAATQVARALRPLAPGLQLFLPRHRLEVPVAPEPLAAELHREWPGEDGALLAALREPRGALRGRRTAPLRGAGAPAARGLRAHRPSSRRGARRRPGPEADRGGASVRVARRSPLPGGAARPPPVPLTPRRAAGPADARPRPRWRPPRAARRRRRRAGAAGALPPPQLTERRQPRPDLCAARRRRVGRARQWPDQGAAARRLRGPPCGERVRPGERRRGLRAAPAAGGARPSGRCAHQAPRDPPDPDGQLRASAPPRCRHRSGPRRSPSSTESRSSSRSSPRAGRTRPRRRHTPASA